MNRNQSEIRSKSHIRMIPEMKEWFKSQSDTPDKLVELMKDLAAHTYNPYWDACIKFALSVLPGFPKKPRKPTKFSIIAFLGMTHKQIDKIDPDLSNVSLQDVYHFGNGTYAPQGDKCACGQRIKEVINVYNPKSGFRFSCGTCCCDKNKLLSVGEIAKAKEEIGAKKNEYIKKRDRKECKGEGCEKFISKKDESELCKSCITKKKKLEEAQRAQEQAEEAWKIQNSARVGRWVIGMPKHRGKTYSDVLEKYPDYLIFQYNRGCWNEDKDDEYPSNPKIREFIEFNLAGRI